MQAAPTPCSKLASNVAPSDGVDGPREAAQGWA